MLRIKIDAWKFCVGFNFIFKVQGWNSYVAFVNDFNSKQENTHDYDVFNKGSESQSWEILA